MINENSSLMHSPLPNTSVSETIESNDCVLAQGLALAEIPCVPLGRVLVRCCGGTDAVTGMGSEALAGSSAIGYALGVSLYATGMAIDYCGSESDSVAIRGSTMVAGDACRAAGLAAQFTPAGAIIGATTLSAAGLVGVTPQAAASVACISWLGTLPMTLPLACYFLILARGSSQEAYPPVSRSSQYASLLTAYHERTRFEVTSARMDPTDPPPYSPQDMRTIEMKAISKHNG